MKKLNLILYVLFLNAAFSSAADIDALPKNAISEDAAVPTVLDGSNIENFRTEDDLDKAASYLNTDGKAENIAKQLKAEISKQNLLSGSNRFEQIQY